MEKCFWTRNHYTHICLLNGMFKIIYLSLLERLLRDVAWEVLRQSQELISSQWCSAGLSSSTSTFTNHFVGQMKGNFIILHVYLNSCSSSLKNYIWWSGICKLLARLFGCLSENLLNWYTVCFFSSLLFTTNLFKINC